MDSKLKAIIPEKSSVESWEYGSGVEEGFKLAIELLRQNKYYGHYAGYCANWLEQHLDKEVSSKTTVTKRGY